MKAFLARSWTSLSRPILNHWIECLGFLAIAGLANELYFRLDAATSDIGYMFGWLIGASKSPTAEAVAPVIFGLLGVVVFASIAAILGISRREFSDRKSGEIRLRRAIVGLVFNLIAAIAVAHFATWFIYHAGVGIDHGTAAREAAVKAGP